MITPMRMSEAFDRSPARWSVKDEIGIPNLFRNHRQDNSSKTNAHKKTQNHRHSFPKQTHTQINYLPITVAHTPKTTR